MNPCRRRRVGAHLLLIGATLALTACGGSGHSGSATTSSASGASPPHVGGTLPQSAVEQALQATGQMAQGMLTFSIPRADLHFSRAGTPIQPDVDQDAEIHFVPLGPGRALVGGELPLLEAEAPRVLAALATSGLQDTALHNHLTRLTPTLLWVHFLGQGEPVALARAVHAALRLTGIPLPYRQMEGQKTSLDSQGIGRILGGDTMIGDGGVVEAEVPRRDPVTLDGIAVPATFGLTAHVYFEPLGHGRAASTGELPLVAPEVAPVITSLEQQGIEVTALHNHWLTDSPHLFYVHYWAQGSATGLATKLKSALGRAAFGG